MTLTTHPKVNIRQNKIILNPRYVSLCMGIIVFPITNIHIYMIFKVGWLVFINFVITNSKYSAVWAGTSYRVTVLIIDAIFAKNITHFIGVMKRNV